MLHAVWMGSLGEPRWVCRGWGAGSGRRPCDGLPNRVCCRSAGLVATTRCCVLQVEEGRAGVQQAILAPVLVVGVGVLAVAAVVLVVAQVGVLASAALSAVRPAQAAGQRAAGWVVGVKE